MRGILFLPIDFPAMTNAMHKNGFFFVNDFVNNPIIPFAKFIETCQITLKRDGTAVFDIFCEPLDARNNALCHWLIQTLQILARHFQEVNRIHFLGQAEPYNDIIQQLATLALGNFLLLLQKALMQGIVDH